MEQKIRIGIVVSRMKEVFQWEKTILSGLPALKEVEIPAYIISEQNVAAKKSTGFRLFEKFESLWFGKEGEAFSRSQIEVDQNIVCVDIDDEETLKTLNLDIIYVSSGVQAINKLEAFASHGVWYHEFKVNETASHDLIGFWEVMNDSVIIESALNVKRVNQNPITIFRGTTGTVPYSVTNTRNNIGWKTSTYLAARINELLRLGPHNFFSKYEGQMQQLPIPVLRNSPRSIQMTGLFIRNVFRYIKYKLSIALSGRRFTILVSNHKFSLDAFDLNAFIPFRMPVQVFWADPFLVEKDEKSYVFFEEYNYKKNKAHISMMLLDKGGYPSKSTIILDKTYHLSYPFIFEYRDELFMMPETASQKTVELYKCKSFPENWEFVGYLMKDIVLIDSTLLFHNDKWWLFGTSPNAVDGSTNDQLFLYYNDSLFSGEWISHSQNPVISDISNCRPAGRIFSMNGKLYRPAQNNASKHYGYGMKINEIMILDEREYKEIEVLDILPDGKRLTGVHTINFNSDFVVIDGIL